MTVGSARSGPSPQLFLPRLPAAPRGTGLTVAAPIRWSILIMKFDIDPFLVGFDRVYNVPASRFSHTFTLQTLIDVMHPLWKEPRLSG